QRAGESAEPAPVAPRSSVDPDLHRSGLDEDSDLASGARAFVNGIGYFDGAKPVNSVGASGGQTGNPARKVLHFLGQRIDRIRLPSEKFLPDVDRGIKAKGAATIAARIMRHDQIHHRSVSRLHHPLGP